MRNKRGITLIALVITIIILLILAGITIIQLTESGLFEEVQLAKEKSEQAQAKENQTLEDYKNKINQYIDGTRNENSKNYSKDEQVVGTWVDGKPIYRRVFILNGPSKINEAEILYEEKSTIDTIINLDRIYNVKK